MNEKCTSLNGYYDETLVKIWLVLCGYVCHIRGLGTSRDEKSFEWDLYLYTTEYNSTSKTTFNNDQPRSDKEKDLWLETL